MASVKIIRNGKSTDTYFDSFKSARRFFKDICRELRANKEEHHSISSVEEGYTDRVCLMRGRFVDTWSAINADS